jgi:quinol monooxygenase YgiN
MVMAIGTATVVMWPLHNVAGVSRELATLPDPELVRRPDPDEGPVLVTLTYTVEDDRVPAFLDAIEQVRRSRLRTGARSSDLYQDGADPSRFVLVSEYDTWAEHLREHSGRLTVADQQLYQAASALAVERPEVRHMFMARKRS